MTWRDISEAPRDGAPFLVWGRGYEWPEVIRWHFYDPEDAAEIGEEGYFHYAEKALADRFNWDHDDVTHWQHLPTPPGATS